MAERNDPKAVDALEREVAEEVGREFLSEGHSPHSPEARAERAKRTHLRARAQGVIAWESLNSAAAQISAISAQVEAASIALEGVQREAQVGARTILDVLDAEQELLDARVNLVRAQRNHRVAAYQMLSATGLLNAQTLGLEVDLYDPIVHYGQVRDQWIGGNDMATEDAQR